MILSAVLVVFGLMLGITATQLWDLRLSGVIVVPLFAVYTLYDLAALPVLVLSVAIAYAGLAVITERTLLYGRQLLYVAIFFGALVPLALIAVTRALGVVTYSIEMYALGSILPGIAAYNMYKVDRERLLDDVVASASAYLALIVVGVAFVSQTTASWLGEWSPLLFSPGADVAQFREVTVTGSELGTVHDPLVGIGVVFAGLLVSMVVETVWDVRLVGIIALPLLALFFVAHPVVLVFYVGCVAVTYGIIQLVHRQTLVYGRVLLSLSVVVAVVLSVPVAMTVAVSGHHLLFVALLSGVGAYNVHRLSGVELRRSIRLSVAVLSGFILLVSALSGPPSTPGGGAVFLLVAVAAVVFGTLTAIRLENRRRRDSHILRTEVHPE